MIVLSCRIEGPIGDHQLREEEGEDFFLLRSWEDQAWSHATLKLLMFIHHLCNLTQAHQDDGAARFGKDVEQEIDMFGRQAVGIVDKERFEIVTENSIGGMISHLIAVRTESVWLLPKADEEILC